MIISFSVENFLSFKEEIHFSMIANGREDQHSERVAKLNNYNKMILPVSELFGGNASGKSNFVKAIGFAREYILSGISKDQKIEVKPFKLSSETMKNPSKFVFQILLNENIYEYGFEITSEEVKREWLFNIGKKTSKKIYTREKNKYDFNYPAWGITNGVANAKQYIDFIADSTLSNKLYLSNVNDIRIEEHKELDILQSVYDWFIQLIIISPEASYLFSKKYSSNKQMIEYLSNLLQQLDTGLSSFEINEVSIPKKIIENSEGFIDADILKSFKIDLKSLRIDKNKDNYIGLQKLTKHIDESGDSIEFSLGEESDGTERLIDLLPAFYLLCKKKLNRVIIIDEFNRSLHPLLTQKLLKAYLSCCNENSRSQLIFTTHDVMLLDQIIFRRDEIWFTERDKHGATKLSSLSDFKNVRKDKRLRNDYLIGRFDGIPNIVLPSNAMLSISKDIGQKKGND
ncbi:ATP-binding protein [bacterium]|nr:ATP-binding protein [bacterium]